MSHVHRLRNSARIFFVTVNLRRRVKTLDAAGHVTDLWLCTPYNCGSASIWNTHYTYDYAGDMLRWTHPAGFTITNTLGSDGRISQMTDSLSDATHPGTLATITYAPQGALSTHRVITVMLPTAGGTSGVSTLQDCSATGTVTDYQAGQSVTGTATVPGRGGGRKSLGPA